MKTMKREEAVEEMRRRLLELTDDEHSICQVAGEKRVFCHGFKQWNDTEMFRRFRWIAQRQKITDRYELEAAANRWHLQRQHVLGVVTACDAQQADHDQCWGWDEFTNEQLAAFYKELCEDQIEVTS